MSASIDPAKMDPTSLVLQEVKRYVKERVEELREYLEADVDRDQTARYRGAIAELRDLAKKLEPRTMAAVE